MNMTPERRKSLLVVILIASLSLAGGFVWLKLMLDDPYWLYFLGGWAGTVIDLVIFGLIYRFLVPVLSKTQMKFTSWRLGAIFMIVLTLSLLFSGMVASINLLVEDPGWAYFILGQLGTVGDLVVFGLIYRYLLRR